MDGLRRKKCRVDTPTALPSATLGGRYEVLRYRDATTSNPVGVCHLNFDLDELDMWVQHKIDKSCRHGISMNHQDKEKLFNSINGYSDLTQNLHNDEAMVHFWCKGQGEQIAWVGFGDRRCHECRTCEQPYCRVDLKVKRRSWTMLTCEKCRFRYDFSCCITFTVSDSIVQLYKEHFESYFLQREKVLKDMETIGANLEQVKRWRATLKRVELDMYVSEQEVNKGAATGAGRAVPASNAAGPSKRRNPMQVEARPDCTRGPCIVAKSEPRTYVKLEPRNRVKSEAQVHAPRHLATTVNLSKKRRQVRCLESMLKRSRTRRQ